MMGRGGTYQNLFARKFFICRTSQCHAKRVLSQVILLVGLLLSSIKCIKGKDSGYTMVFRKATWGELSLVTKMEI